MNPVRPVGQHVSTVLLDLMAGFLGVRPGSGDLGTPTWPEGDPWWRLYAKCESPIECLMCVALSANLQCVPVAEDYDFDMVHALVSNMEEQRAYLLYAQQPLLQYRVDFMLAYYDARSDHFERIVIECDGHAYHMGSVDNMIKDRHRDRDLNRIHCPVFHFTGSQIYRAADLLVASLVSP